MNKIKKTYLELQIFSIVATKYLDNNGYIKDESPTNKEPTKLVSNLRNVLKQSAKHFEIFNDEIDSLRINNCAVDSVTKIQLKNEKNERQFTIDGEIKLKKEIKSLLATEVIINQRITDDFENLSEQELEVFSELVIPKQNDSAGE